MSMFRAALLSYFALAAFGAFGWILTGCGGMTAQAVQTPGPGASEAALVGDKEAKTSQCDAAVVQQRDGTYAKLSDTGLYCSIAQNTIDRHARYYAPEVALWIDGASKRRYMRLPPGARIDSTDMDNWLFPVGMKVWKELSVGGAKIETRMLEKRSDNSWLMVSFKWNSQQSEAYPVPSGVLNANGTQHDIPSVGQCHACHDGPADALVSLSPLMLERASPWGLTLFDLVAQGSLTRNPTRAIRFPGNQQTRDALAYLYANCSVCHRGVRAPVSLELSTSVWDQTPEETAVYRTVVNRPLIAWVRDGYLMRVAGGSPGASGVLARMSSRDPLNQMPKIGTEVVDEAGLKMIYDWIIQLPAPRRLP